MVPAPDLGAHDDARTRIELIVSVTAQVLAEDAGLTFCEALRLVDAARRAVLRSFPEHGETFELFIRPRLDAIIERRFGLPPPQAPSS
ncbi:MAG TPA: hypothetical protein P5234_02900 [Thermoanaerobaculaceae bacterium]|nr:hypothetical protein [Thermoanaerobaculaceae bacterium]HRS15177.1 hypothetical protein [Thermoanaerobaculaceae bacterium]